MGRRDKYLAGYRLLSADINPTKCAEIAAELKYSILETLAKKTKHSIRDMLEIQAENIKSSFARIFQENVQKFYSESITKMIAAFNRIDCAALTETNVESEIKKSLSRGITLRPPYNYPYCIPFVDIQENFVITIDEIVGNFCTKRPRLQTFFFALFLNNSNTFFMLANTTNSVKMLIAALTNPNIHPAEHLEDDTHSPLQTSTVHPESIVTHTSSSSSSSSSIPQNVQILQIASALKTSMNAVLFEKTRQSIDDDTFAKQKYFSEAINKIMTILHRVDHQPLNDNDLNSYFLKQKTDLLPVHPRSMTQMIFFPLADLQTAVVFKGSKTSATIAISEIIKNFLRTNPILKQQFFELFASDLREKKKNLEELEKCLNTPQQTIQQSPIENISNLLKYLVTLESNTSDLYLLPKIKDTITTLLNAVSAFITHQMFQKFEHLTEESVLPLEIPFPKIFLKSYFDKTIIFNSSGFNHEDKQKIRTLKCMLLYIRAPFSRILDSPQRCLLREHPVALGWLEVQEIPSQPLIQIHTPFLTTPNGSVELKLEKETELSAKQITAFLQAPVNLYECKFLSVNIPVLCCGVLSTKHMSNNFVENRAHAIKSAILKIREQRNSVPSQSTSSSSSSSNLGVANSEASPRSRILSGEKILLLDLRFLLNAWDQTIFENHTKILSTVLDDSFSYHPLLANVPSTNINLSEIISRLGSNVGTAQRKVSRAREDIERIAGDTLPGLLINPDYQINPKMLSAWTKLTGHLSQKNFLGLNLAAPILALTLLLQKDSGYAFEVIAGCATAKDRTVVILATTAAILPLFEQIFTQQQPPHTNETQSIPPHSDHFDMSNTIVHDQPEFFKIFKNDWRLNWSLLRPEQKELVKNNFCTEFLGFINLWSVGYNANKAIPLLKEGFLKYAFEDPTFLTQEMTQRLHDLDIMGKEV